MNAALAPIMGFVGAFLLVPGVRSLGLWLGVVDVPGEAKIHVTPTPRVGGVAIAFAIGLTWALIRIANSGLWAGTVVAFGVGLLDDRYSLNPVVKLAGQLAAAVLFVASAGLGLGPLASAAAVLYLLVVINGTNFIDGLDGLASGVTCIELYGAAALSLSAGLGSWGAAAFAAAGAAFGFLIHNLRRGYCFMGDSGSHVLGFLVGAAAVGAWAARPSWPTGIAVAVMTALPIFDVLSSMGRRLQSRKRTMEGDLDHFYNKMALRWGTYQAVFVCWLLAAAGVALAWMSRAGGLRSAAVLVGAVIAGTFGAFNLGYVHLRRCDRGDPAGGA